MGDGSVRLDLGEVATITLDRPEVANCLSRATLDELRDAIERVRLHPDIPEGELPGMPTDEPVRCLILTGTGDKAFCAGADLKERAGMTDDEVREYIRTIRDTLTAVADLEQPVIAAINGAAFGGGAELALAADIRVMADSAQIGLTETSLGILPGGGGTQRLPRLVGRGRALEMILAARRVGAEEALRIGLVEEVVPAADVLRRAREIAERIAANAPLAVRAAKAAVTRGLEMPLAEGLDLETKLYERMLGTKDRLEGLRAFRERRPPEYKGE